MFVRAPSLFSTREGVASARLRQVFFVSVAFSLSCGGTARNVAAPSPPTAAQAQWVTAAVGGTPDFQVVLRPNAIRTDSYWGRMVDRALRHSDGSGDFIGRQSASLALNAQQVDVYVVVRDPLQTSHKADSIGWVGIIYGHVPFDPLTLKSGNGTPMFSPPMPTPSGVYVYPPAAAYAEEYKPFAPTLFFLPDGTYVVADPTSASRTQALLAQRPVGPPALVTAADTLAGGSFGVTAVRFARSDKPDDASVTQHMVAAGLGLRGGAGAAIEGYADYASSEDADAAHGAIRRKCGERTDACIVSPSLFRDASVQQDGRRVAFSFVFSDKLLYSLQRAFE